MKGEGFGATLLNLCVSILSSHPIIIFGAARYSYANECHIDIV